MGASYNCNTVILQSLCWFLKSTMTLNYHSCFTDMSWLPTGTSSRSRQMEHQSMSQTSLCKAAAVRLEGIEPPEFAWKANMLPLHHSPCVEFLSASPLFLQYTRCGVRTRDHAIKSRALCQTELTGQVVFLVHYHSFIASPHSLMTATGFEPAKHTHISLSDAPLTRLGNTVSTPHPTYFPLTANSVATTPQTI